MKVVLSYQDWSVLISDEGEDLRLYGATLRLASSLAIGFLRTSPEKVSWLRSRGWLDAPVPHPMSITRYIRCQGANITRDQARIVVLLTLHREMSKLELWTNLGIGRTALPSRVRKMLKTGVVVARRKNNQTHYRLRVFDGEKVSEDCGRAEA